ncbi:MAG: hypothetical protein U0869_25020 [Chloroflexota bacterium]
MSRSLTLRRRLLAGGLLLTVAALAAPSATFAKAGDVIRTGDCSGATNWKIKAHPDDTGLEVEAEVDQNKNGQAWSWTLKNDGVRVAGGTATTRAPSGSFTVKRTTADGAGRDTLVFRATNAKTGETCRASVTI